MANSNGALALAVLLGLSGAVARAQSGPPPDPPPPADAGHCLPKVQKVVRPTVVDVKHTRICYDAREEDFALTRCVPTPILTSECFEKKWWFHAPKPLTADCVNCGKPRVRKILIKRFITETVTVPKCEVQRVTAPVADLPAAVPKKP